MLFAKKKSLKMSVLVVAIGSGVTGCGTLTGIPSHGGGKRFAVEQKLLTASVKASVKKIDMRPFAGKKVRLHFALPNDEGGGQMVGGRAAISALFSSAATSGPITSTNMALQVFDLANASNSSGQDNTTGTDTINHTNNMTGSDTNKTITDLGQVVSNSNGTNTTDPVTVTTSLGKVVTTTNNPNVTSTSATDAYTSTQTTQGYTTSQINPQIISSQINPQIISSQNTSQGVTTTETGSVKTTQTTNPITTTQTTPTFTTTQTTPAFTVQTTIPDVLVTSQMPKTTTTNTTNKYDVIQTTDASINKQVTDKMTGQQTGSTTTNASQNVANTTTTFGNTNKQTGTTDTSRNTNSKANQNGYQQTVEVAGYTQSSKGRQKESGGALAYSGMGSYQLMGVPKSDHAYFMEAVRQFFIFNGVELIPNTCDNRDMENTNICKNNQSANVIDVHISLDVFGMNRSRTELIAYNQETLALETGFELVAYDSRSKAVISRQNSDMEAIYKERYMFWVGPLQKQMIVRPSSGLLVTFDLKDNQGKDITNTDIVRDTLHGKISPNTKHEKY